MAKERNDFTTEELLAGLDVLDRMEQSEVITPCDHRYRNLFPEIAEKLSEARTTEGYLKAAEPYANVFASIATCAPCVEKYMQTVRDLEENK